LREEEPQNFLFPMKLSKYGNVTSKRVKQKHTQFIGKSTWTAALTVRASDLQVQKFLGNFLKYIVSYSYCCVNHLREDTYIFVIQDITPIKTLENELKEGKLQLEKTVLSRTRQLQEALEVKSRFLAIMSHEIRTPLSGILGNVTVIFLLLIIREFDVIGRDVIGS
jgi:signal transduction histidine kinase